MVAQKKTTQKAKRGRPPKTVAKVLAKAAKPGPKAKAKAKAAPGQRKLSQLWSPEVLGCKLRPERYERKRPSAAVISDAKSRHLGAKARAKKDDVDVEFVREDVEVIDVADDSDSDVVAYPETPVKREARSPTPVKAEPPTPAVAEPDPPPVQHNLRYMTSAEIEDAWRGEGLAHPEKQFLCREVLLHEEALRAEAKEVVHRAICARQEQYEKYEEDYHDVFCRSTEYRILAAFMDGKLTGGMAIKMVPKGVYLEFLGTAMNSHAGKPIVKQLKQWVKVHPDLHFVVLNSLDPVAMQRASAHALHTLSFWSERGFQPLDAQTLARVTACVEPERGLKRPFRMREFYKLFDVPEASTGTSAMIWIPAKPRAGE